MSAAGGAATFVALHVLTFGQTFSLMSNLAIPNLPPQFRQVWLPFISASHLLPVSASTL